MHRLCPLTCGQTSRPPNLTNGTRTMLGKRGLRHSIPCLSEHAPFPLSTLSLPSAPRSAEHCLSVLASAPCALCLPDMAPRGIGGFGDVAPSLSPLFWTLPSPPRAGGLLVSVTRPAPTTQ